MRSEMRNQDFYALPDKKSRDQYELGFISRMKGQFFSWNNSVHFINGYVSAQHYINQQIIMEKYKDKRK